MEAHLQCKQINVFLLKCPFNQTMAHGRLAIASAKQLRLAKKADIRSPLIEAPLLSLKYIDMYCAVY